jgi:hypothetical protein
MVSRAWQEPDEHTSLVKRVKQASRAFHTSERID